MIKDQRTYERYGISTVVGDLHSPEVPTAINRTILEYAQLRRIMDTILPFEFDSAIEFGCGYGRMLPLLQEYSGSVIGLERDEELANLAHKLNPETSIGPLNLGVRTVFDLGLTYTFLQHLNRAEFDFEFDRIKSVIKPNGHLIAVEAFYGEDICRAKGFVTLYREPRVKEATNPNKDVGTVYVLKKLNSLERGK